MKNFAFIFLAFIFLSCESPVDKYESVIKDESFRNNVLKNNPGEYVNLTNGFTYFEEVNVDSKKGTVVLVHGYSIPSYIMNTLFTSLKNKDYRVIMMDLFGRGYSENPDLPQTDSLRANQVIELLENRQIEFASIVGLSNGGRIISKIADLKPEIVKSLFYIASSGFYEYEKLDDKNVSQEEIDNLILSYPEMAEGQKNDFLDPSKFPEWVDKYNELLTHKGFAKALISTTKNLETLDNVHIKIDSLDIPVFTFWGEFDEVVVYDLFKERLNMVLPNRIEYIISNSGHLPHMENQEEFEKLFFKHLDSISLK